MRPPGLSPIPDLALSWRTANWVSVAAFAAAWLAIIAWRIRIEETALLSALGEAAESCPANVTCYGTSYCIFTDSLRANGSGPESWPSHRRPRATIVIAYCPDSGLGWPGLWM